MLVATICPSPAQSCAQWWCVHLYPQALALMGWPSSVHDKPHSAVCFLSKKWSLRADNTACSPEHRTVTQAVGIYPMEHSYFLKGR